MLHVTTTTDRNTKKLLLYILWAKKKYTVNFNEKIWTNMWGMLTGFNQ